jgi:hypothetical protein
MMKMKLDEGPTTPHNDDVEVEEDSDSDQQLVSIRLSSA